MTLADPSPSDRPLQRARMASTVPRRSWRRLGATADPDRDDVRALGAAGPPGRGLPRRRRSRRCRGGRPRSRCRRSRTASTTAIWPASGRASATASACTARGTPRMATGAIRRKLLLDPYARAIDGDARPTTTGSSPTARTAPDSRGAGAAVGRGRRGARRVRLVRRRPPRVRRGATPCSTSSMCKGFTSSPSGRAGAPARDVRRAGAPGGDRAPGRTRRDRGRAACPCTTSCPSEPLAVAGEVNAWGYNSIGFFAPHAPYASSGSRGEQVRRVQGHGARDARRRSRGRARRRLQPHRRERPRPDRRCVSAESTTPPTTGSTAAARYRDVTGCGNTLDLRHPQVVRLVLDSLRYWVEEMHVDGFRFDLAPALARGDDARRHGLGLPHRRRAGPSAARRQADRGALGPRPRRLPARPVPSPVG